jgi:hypothetical protein
MGLCVPWNCDAEDINEMIGPMLLRYAADAHWKNPSVTFTESMYYTTYVSRPIDHGKKVAFGVIGMLAVICIFGCIIECTKIGDDPEFDPEILERATEFKSSLQYDSVIIQKKKHWTHVFLAFSCFRNINRLNMPSDPQKEAARVNKDTPAKEVTARLGIFHGIKAISCMYAMLGLSFLFSWYSIIGNVQDIEQKKMSYSFAIVYGSMYACPILFMTAGFLQTHKFLQVDHPSKLFTAGNLFKYYVWRFTKFMVINAMGLVFAMYLI